MSEIGVGKEVLSYCSKCKLVLAHIVASMKSHTTVGQVICNTCKSTHAYKDPSGSKSKTQKKSTSTTKKTLSIKPVAELWLDAVNNTSAKSKPYLLTEKFIVGDIIDHPSFGPGVVEKIIDNNKIQVIFRHDIKTLIHAR